MSKVDTEVNLRVLKSISGSTMNDIKLGINNQSFEGEGTKEELKHNVSGQLINEFN